MGALSTVGLEDVRVEQGHSLALVIRFSSLRHSSAAPDVRAATRAILRSVLGRLADCPPESLRFEKTVHGKPYLADFEAITFNVSHSQGHSLIALSLSGAIGCDVEDRFGDDDARQLSPLTLHATEMRAMGCLAERERHVAFRRFWVRKEAVLKAAGSGFQDDPRGVIVGLEDQLATWTCRDLQPPFLHNCLIADGCPAAVASLDPLCLWYVFEP